MPALSYQKIFTSQCATGLSGNLFYSKTGQESLRNHDKVLRELCCYVVRANLLERFFLVLDNQNPRLRFSYDDQTLTSSRYTVVHASLLPLPGIAHADAWDFFQQAPWIRCFYELPQASTSSFFRPCSPPANIRQQKRPFRKSTERKKLSRYCY